MGSPRAALAMTAPAGVVGLGARNAWMGARSGRGAARVIGTFGRETSR